MKTFIQLKQEVLRFFDLDDEPAGSPDTTLVENAINQANQRRAAEDAWKFMLSNRFTVAVVAGTDEYILPHTDLDRLQYLWSLTNNRFLSSVPMRSIPIADVSFAQNQASDNRYYEIDAIGSMVATQPSAPDRLLVDSTENEADDVALFVEGEDEDGVAISETIAPGDRGELDFAKITYYAKEGDWTGTLTVVTEGGDDVLTLSPTEYGKEYAVLRFFNIPTQNESFQYRYFRAPRVMSRDYDRPDLPFPISNLLVYDALLDLATYHELDSESVNIWRDKQSQWENVLYQQKLEGDNINGLGSFIGDTGQFPNIGSF